MDVTRVYGLFILIKHLFTQKYFLLLITLIILISFKMVTIININNLK